MGSYKAQSIRYSVLIGNFIYSNIDLVCTDDNDSPINSPNSFYLLHNADTVIKIQIYRFTAS